MLLETYTGSNIVIDDRTKMKISSNVTELEFNDIKELLSNVRKEVLEQKSGLNFDKPTAFNDDDYYNLKGLTREQFDDLAMYPKNVQYSAPSSPRICLALLLCKLRCGMSHKFL